MASDSNTWKPPVLFHFRVDFQWKGGDKASASFAEVDGLSQELVLAKGEDNIELPEDVKYTNIILKRALEPVNEDISLWINNAFRFKEGIKITPCTLLISLLDEQDNIVAKWTCEWTFPIKWSINPLNASESKVAVETITLRYKSLRRSE
ncbi:phage tail protein [Bacteroides togonis]|uniref:phage tail protein n=1 Tax=Bacteroides togonis TaxID=1917883 RepID=UPI00094AF444|nr:phage tail protein [Bacteroides togonis]